MTVGSAHLTGIVWLAASDTPQLAARLTSVRAVLAEREQMKSNILGGVRARYLTAPAISPRMKYFWNRI